MFAFFAGLAAGLLHVFSGPDHLAAVAPMAADSDRSHWRTGLQWGFGHTAGVLMIAALLLIVRDQLPLDAISAYSERIVGVALIAVGGWGIWGAWVRRCEGAGTGTRRAHNHGSASVGMGIVHGLAGSSHLFGVIPALAFATRLESMSYLAGFGMGAIAGMTAFAAGIGLLSLRLGHSRSHYRGLLFASSAAALVVGGFWLVGR
jgi:hypothetical protein